MPSCCSFSEEASISERLFGFPSRPMHAPLNSPSKVALEAQNESTVECFLPCASFWISSLLRLSCHEVNILFCAIDARPEELDWIKIFVLIKYTGHIMGQQKCPRNSILLPEPLELAVPEWASIGPLRPLRSAFPVCLEGHTHHQGMLIASTWTHFSNRLIFGLELYT